MSQKNTSTPPGAPAGVAAQRDEVAIYHAEMRNADMARIRVSCIVAAVGILAAIAVDAQVSPDHLYELIATRGIISLAAGAIWSVARRPDTRVAPETLGLALFVLGAVGMIALIVVSDHDTGYHDSLALLYLAFACFIPNHFKSGLAAMTGATVLYATSVMFLGLEGRPEEFKNKVFLVMLAQGVSTFFAHFTRNLTKRERAARAGEISLSQQLQDANQKLIHADELKNESFANLSHELRTPIALFRGCVESVLTQGDLSDGNRKQLSIAQLWSVRLLGIINELLDLAKLDSKIESMVKNRFDLALLVRELVAQSAPHATKQRLALTYASPADLVVTVVGDYKRIERVCINLLSNAIKYTNENGRIAVSVTPHGERVHVVVSDTGIGIKPDDLERVFHRFVQIKTDGRQGRGGVGIGLALCKSIVESHDGVMTVSSVYRQGSNFGFVIPLAGPVTMAAAGATRILQFHPDSRGSLEDWDEATRERDGYRMQKITQASERRVIMRIPNNPNALKVLIVEDNSYIVTMIDGMIGGEYNLQWARDGLQGVEKVESFRPDLVITDVNMPNMDGEQFVRAVRKQVYGATIPIVVLTAKGLDADRNRLIEAGADHFLLKGFDAGELKNMLRTQLKRQVSNRKMVEDERMLALRAMAGGIAHEILNPINLLGNYVGQLERTMAKVGTENPSGDAQSALLQKMGRAIEGIQSNLGRATAALQPLRRLSQGEESHAPMEQQQINPIVTEVLRAVDTKNNIMRDLRATKSVIAQKGRLEQIIINLVVNAQQACGDKYTTPIAVSTRDATDGKSVEIRVTDHGPGMSEEVLSRIFTPYFTTKETGTGLGLHVCREIIAAHGGSLTVQSSPNHGATFTMVVPAATR